MARKKLDTVVNANNPLFKELLASYINEYAKYTFVGTGSPEGVVTAPVGSVYHRADGGAGTSFYVKESGTGNTGWVGK